MRGFLRKLAEIRNEIGRTFNQLPFWPQVMQFAALLCLPVTGPARLALKICPPLKKLDWLLEIELVTRRNPVLLALSLLFVAFRGAMPTRLGHIGTDQAIYPTMALISGFNPFLGLVCGGVFGVFDLMQKLVAPDIFGANWIGDLNYWGAMVGYVVAYSSVMVMGVGPGLASRLVAAIVRLVLRKVVFRQAAATADGAAPLTNAVFPVAEMVAGMVVGYATGHLIMSRVAPITEKPAFYWRPQPDVSCHQLEVNTLLVGRAPVGGAGGFVGGAVPVLTPPAIPGLPPGMPPEIEWQGPDGKTNVLVWNPEHKGYINILTGGLVDPNNIEGWKQNIIQTNQQVQDWRAHNQWLQSTGQDAQSQALAGIRQEWQNRAEILSDLGKIEKSVMFGSAQGLFQPPGSPANILDSIRQVANQASSGKPIDYNKLNQIIKVYKGTVRGDILPPGDLPKPGDADKGVWVQTIENTIKEVTTCTNSDGGFSVKGMIVRGGLGILTGGWSEVPISVQVMKDYVDAGGNSVVGGFVQAAGSVIVGEAVGAVVGGVVKGAVIGGKAGAFVIKTIVKEAAAGGSSVAKGLVKVAGVITQTGGKLVKPLASGLKSAEDILSTEIKIGGADGGKAVSGGVVGGAGKAVGHAEGGAVSGGAGKAGQAVSKGEAAAAGGAKSAAGAEGQVAAGGKKSYTYAHSPGENVTPHMKGMPKASIEHAQQVADAHNVQLMVRPTNPEAAKLLQSGKALPKPCAVKNKTITDLDVMLGANADDVGKVGHFEPELPPQGNMSKADYDALKNRFQQRHDEFIKQEQVLAANPNVVVKNGVVHDVKTGKPFTGDHDVFDVLGKDGKPVPAHVKEQVLKDLQQPPFNAQHGSHMDWKYDHLAKDPPPGAPPGTQSDFTQAQTIDTKIINGHQVGEEPLITFAPKQPPHVSYVVGKRG